MNLPKKPADLDWVNPAHIKRSDENPRSDDFFKDKDFLRLKESVAKYGVIVPIIIQKLSKEENGIKYQLIDGERRWKAASDTNQSTIPAYVLPPGVNLNILITMFQIHMNQESWDAIEQARALEEITYALRQELRKEFNEDELDKELVKQLMSRTGMDENNAYSRIRFLKWPKKIRDYIYHEVNKNHYSYAVEIEAKIIEPALRNFPDIADKISPDSIREALFEKVKGGYVSRAEEIRDAAILIKRRADKREETKARSLFLRFIKDKTFTFPEAREQYFFLFPDEAQKPPISPRKLLNNLRFMIRALKEYPEASLGKLGALQKRELTNMLNELSTVANEALRKLGK